MSARPIHYYLNALNDMHARLWPEGRLVSFLLLALLCAGFFSGCASFYYSEGKGLVEKGQVEEGLKKFERAIESDPHSAIYRQAYLQTRERATYKFLQQAEQLATAGKSSDAEKLYNRVLSIDTENDRAKAGLRALEMNARHAVLLNEAEAALEKKDLASSEAKLSTILSENPRNPAANTLQRSLAEKDPLPQMRSTLSAAYKRPITIEFKDISLKQVFEVISRTSGLNFLFDKDVKTDQKTSIFLKNSTIESAVYFTLLTNQLEQQVLDANTILIYPNTPAKQKDYQETVVKTFFLANAEAKTVANTLKTILKSPREIVADEKLNMLIMRDSPEAIKLAEKLIALHDQPEPEVMLEVEILEVKRTRLMELGIQWPDSLTLTPLAPPASSALTLDNLRGLNQRRIGASVSPVTVNAKKQDSDANILANPRIRTRNHEKAKILIGERVPNITTTATSTGFVSESINYVDIGLKLDVEPTIYLDDDVSIKISLEVSNIVNQLQTKAGSVAYQIGTRNATTVLRLKDGENQVLAGLINDEDRKSARKLPGLGDLPLLGHLFGSTSDDNLKTEIVLSITPHLVRNIRRPDATMAEFLSGTDNSFRVRPASGGGILPTAQRTSLKAVPTTNPGMAIQGDGDIRDVNPPLNASVGNYPSDNALAGDQGTANGGALLKWRGPVQAKAGDLINLELLMQSTRPVTNVPVSIGFDNAVLQIVGITEGDFLKQGGAQSSFTSRIDPTGKILLIASRSGIGGATVPGMLATIAFRALAPAGETQIKLLSASPVSDDGNAVATPLPAPLTISIQP